ncbi:MAG TPA: hypothetical protein V6D17_15140 [Candidatus Obscuribacterales bacterium]
MVIFKDIGEIEQIEIPSDWVEAPRLETVGGRTLRKFHPLARPDIRLCSYHRSVPISAPAARAFQHTLYSPFHDLSHEELMALEEVFEGLVNANAFEIVNASTGYLNNRRMIKVVGRWLETKQDSVAYFFDVDGKGESIQQLYYAAPADEFDQHESAVRTILQSIEWKR